MKTIAAIFAATVAFNPAFAAPTERPPVPAAKPVTETLFGQSITDQFRYFEQQDATLTDWMKAEGRYARSVLDALPQHDATLAKLSAMTGSWDVVGTITTAAGGRTFYEQRSSGSDNFDLMVREADGKTRKLVDVSAIRAANGGEPFAINYFTPSNDGNKIAVGISEGGSEDASLWIYDVATGSRIAGPVPNAQFGIIGWTPDDRHLFTTLMQGVKPGRPETDKYLNSKAYVWDLKGAPVPILGVGISPAVPFKPEEFPGVFTVPDAPLALAVNVNGVQNEMAIWTAPVTAAGSADAPWKPFVKRDDDVTNIAVAGNRIFLLSHKDAPTFKVLALNAGEPIGAAKEVIAARPDRVIEGIAAASDGLYVRARRGVYSELLKIPLEGGPEQAIELPFKGSINELSADPRYPGVKLILDSWAVPQRNLAYDPGKGFSDLGVGSAPKGFDPALYEALDLKAKAKDGVQVPLSFVTAKDAKHPRPVMLMAYGSYGISEFPAFGTRTMATLPNGIDYAVCHVRHASPSSPPNTWRDLIACGEELIGSGYTSKDKLFIIGGSAGGITMGRAMEERPDLFAGVFDLVPAANTVRSEFSVSGPVNIPEFGTIANEQGFKNLLAMDTIQHVKSGVKYPPIIITTGLNDPRVSSWEPAKLAATLRMSGDSNPVLFRVDEKAGHGIGSTKTQNDELYADVVTFILAHSGK